MADERDLKADIDTLFSKVSKLNAKVSEFKVTRDFFKEMIKRNTISHEKLAETMKEVQIAMVKMSEKMDDQSQAMNTQSQTIADMRQEFEEANRTVNAKIDLVEQKTNEKIQAVGNKVNEVEDKGKFDIHLFVKKNWPLIVALLGMGFLYIAQYVKF